MAAKKATTPPSIQGLMPAGSNSIDAGLQRQFLLSSHDQASRQASDLVEQTNAANNPTQGLHPLAQGDVGPEWGPWFEALKEGGTTIQAPGRGVDAMPGMHTDDTDTYTPLSTLPSLQGLGDGSTKQGRALQLQQLDAANAKATALANPAGPNQLRRGY